MQKSWVFVCPYRKDCGAEPIGGRDEDAALEAFKTHLATHHSGRFQWTDDVPPENWDKLSEDDPAPEGIVGNEAYE
jgi:hypothetical protein